MWAARDEHGNFWFGGLNQFCVESLRAVPILLESKDPRVRKRLMPDAYVDPEEDAQWRKHTGSDLEHLFLSRAELVRKDLESMRKVPDTETWFLLIPTQHSNAWLSSLNGARLALYLLNDMKPEDMEVEALETATKKKLTALHRIHFMAEVQSVLMGEGYEVSPEEVDGANGNGNGELPEEEDDDTEDDGDE